MLTPTQHKKITNHLFNSKRQLFITIIKKDINIFFVRIRTALLKSQKICS